jgi:cell volume regulation protein A
VHPFTVAPGSVADGRALDQLDELGEEAWVSFLVRESRLVRISGSTQLRAGDELLILAEPEYIDKLARVFSAARPGAHD